MLILGIAFCVTPALAAEVTDMPPALRGDVRIDYAGLLETGSLRDGDKNQGKRRVRGHDLVYGVEFAPMDGVAVWLEVDTTVTRRLTFVDPVEMRYDPVADTGTYAGGDALGALDVRAGSGLNGLWLGAAVGPWAERYDRGQEGTWRLDVGFRSPNPGNTFWTHNGNRRGSAPGGVGWLLRGAWSQENAPGDAYLVGQLLYESGVKVDVIDESGATHATDVVVRPATAVDVTAGVELIAGRDEAKGEKFAFDLFLGFGYRSQADIPSGVVLPDVLPRSEGEIVQEAEHVRGTGGLGLIYHANKYLGFRLAGSATYVTPHRLEHLYTARTGYDTVAVGLQGSIEGRLR